MFVDQYWETSNPDHPLVAISWTFEYEDELPDSQIMVCCSRNNDRIALNKSDLTKPSGKGPNHAIHRFRKAHEELDEPCMHGCPGWHISTVSGETGNREHDLEIQRCDGCFGGNSIGDLDAVALPEAQQALIEEYASS